MSHEEHGYAEDITEQALTVLAGEEFSDDEPTVRRVLERLHDR